MEPRQLTTVEAAVERIRDGDVFSFNGIGAIGFPERFFPALEQRFLREGHPRGLTLYSACGLGTERHEIHHLKHPGLISCLMVGYILPYSVFAPVLEAGEMEGYNLPQGVISMNYRAAAAGQPGFYSKVGLHTFADPRLQGCALNERSRKRLVELHELDGEEYLFYRTVRPNVCVLRGTTADPAGNITLEKEVNVADALAIAMATHNNGGQVLVQVERLSDMPADPRDVRVPGALVDAIWLSDTQRQTNQQGGPCPYYSGEERAPEEVAAAMIRRELSGERYPGKPVSAAERIIARRAALELRGCGVVNLGIGMPMLAAGEAAQMGILKEGVTLTIETGVTGGIPVPDAFGAVLNADAIYDQASQFSLYEGGGLDATLVGALEIDRLGNVNVIRKGGMLFGAGGFQHVTQAKKIVVCSRFRRGSGFTEKNGVPVVVEGTKDKFVQEVECIALNAQYMRSQGRRVIYITERCVLELEDDGLVLTEVTPGLHPWFSILQHIPFPVRVATRLRNMPAECFAFLSEQKGSEGK